MSALMYCSEMQMMFGKLVSVMCLAAIIKLTFCLVGMEMSFQDSVAFKM